MDKKKGYLKGILILSVLLFCSPTGLADNNEGQDKIFVSSNSLIDSKQTDDMLVTTENKDTAQKLAGRITDTESSIDRKKAEPDVQNSDLNETSIAIGGILMILISFGSFFLLLQQQSPNNPS